MTGRELVWVDGVRNELGGWCGAVDALVVVAALPFFAFFPLDSSAPYAWSPARLALVFLGCRNWKVIFKKVKKSKIFSGLRRSERYTIMNTSNALSYFPYPITYFTLIQRHFGCMSAKIWTWSHPSYQSAEFKISANLSDWMNRYSIALRVGLDTMTLSKVSEYWKNKRRRYTGR